ncbi:hypothetical protein NDJ09_09305 [Vibrio alginolyticus]|uniref:hypothetical protein n=1 Tax=Vibrio alginolyticus TaxID=663 RepID=UPI002160BD35|nr:hypothetical protein [Vibrio alginolyticus]MCS0223518.1 hypothetical protein [Vibrio alginolyticus]
MSRPGEKVKAPSYIVMILLIFIGAVGVCVSISLIDNECFDVSDLVSPIAIIFSALLGAFVALKAIASNRREYVRKNTLDVLNNLEMDNEYWTVATSLISRIDKYKQQGKTLPILTEDQLDGIPYHKVLRRLEWLIESAYLGHIDWKELAYRKAVMIDYLHKTCFKLIKEKQDIHGGRYSEETKPLVYQHLADCQLVKNLLQEAKAKANEPNDQTRFQKSKMERLWSILGKRYNVSCQCVCQKCSNQK